MMNKISLMMISLFVFPFSFFLNKNIQKGAEIRDKDLFENVDQKWVDSIFNTMTPEQRIGQLFMIPVYSNQNMAHFEEVERDIKNHNIGGIIFMQGGPVRQINLTNHFQSIAKVPILMSMDAEWGPDMRLDSTTPMPRQLTLGAIQDPDLVYEMGAEVARQLKRLGVHMNFAPVVDVNNNSRNPVINDRSFGENRYNVALRGLQYMKGLQDNGVIAVAKHFPGHGDTDKDSHYDLPVITHNRARLDSLELFPFRIMINQGVLGIMTAHLYIPALDKAVNAAASISETIVTGLLKKELGFEGLIVTDALNMKGVSAFNEPGQAELKALLAGNDILLFPGNIPKSLNLIQKAIKEGKITQAEIDRRVKKILKAKYWAGLNNFQPIPTDNIYDDLNNPKIEALRYKLFENAITVAANKKSMIPINWKDSANIASISIGTSNINEFQQTLTKYAPVNNYFISKSASSAQFSQMSNLLKQYNQVVISLHDMSRFSSRNFGITEETKAFIERLNKETNVILVVFGNPYSLKYFDNIPSVVVAYEDNNISQNVAAQVLFGGVPAKGNLPVTASSNFRFGAGNKIDKASRLGYTIPEGVGLNSTYLQKIDIIINDAIADKATPGAQILVAKDGKVFYHKSFGYHTYDTTRKVKNEDLYDLASITKIAASTISLMKLYDEGKIDLDKSLSKYIPGIKQSSIAKLELKDILTHTAGLQSWIPFYASTVTDPAVYSDYYCVEANTEYCIPVANNLFMRQDFVDSITYIIETSELQKPGSYKYSDLGFYMFRLLVEKQSGLSLDKYVQRNFYQPLGLSTMTYNPLNKFTPDDITPTEFDKIFRRQLIHGYVHDQGAAMLGGVSGHAGLFSNANDLAILMQMLLNGGEYAGKRYIDEKTVNQFTKRQSNKSRRGLGFDKPEPDKKEGPTAPSASKSTFGHTGFTGTATWVDPEHNLVFVFLSNRVHPSAENKKLITNDIRTRVQQVVYDAMANGTASTK